MITEIRDYLKSRIAAVDSDYSQIDDPIGDDDLNRLATDSGFKILIQDNTCEYTGNSYIETFSVQIQLFKKAGIEVTDSFDALYETGISVKNTIIDPLQVKNQTAFTDILVSGMNIESLPTNDKTFKVTINLNVRVDFAF